MSIRMRFHEIVLIYIYFNLRGDVTKFQAGKNLRHV